MSTPEPSAELGGASRQTTPSKHRAETCDPDVYSPAKHLQKETPPPPPGHLIPKPEEEASDTGGSSTAAKRLLFDEAAGPDPWIKETEHEESKLMSELEKEIFAILADIGAMYKVDDDTSDYMHDPPAAPAPSTEDRPSRLPGRHTYIYIYYAHTM
ncbi:unnamed protein product [Urochloa decumbens]|uniref:Uncharacterized protein n=1 Tax=Urochloa decumbens TaxID=240449 RepID=A0ABC9GT91_9POAL